MANPFRTFRKFRKTLIVAAGVVLMFVFVIGDALTGLTGLSGGGGGSARELGAVAVSWDGGSLTNADVDNLVGRRLITNRFLEQVEYAGAESAIRAGIEPRRLRLQTLHGPDSTQEGVEQSVVRTKLFADAAREAGMSVSNEAITQYLLELGRGRVTVDDMRQIIAAMNQGGMRVTSEYIMDALGEEMLANNYISSQYYALQTVTPEQRWKDWLRANDEIIVEAAAIPAESFVIDVPDPKEPELIAFFDKYKNVQVSPDLVDNQVELPSGNPGFLVPRKIDVQYIEANFEKAMAKAEEQVTDEEIAKFYEENKDMFVKADTGLLDDMGLEETESDDSETESQPEATDAATPESGSETAPPAAETNEGATPPAQPENQPASPAETPPATESNEQPQGDAPATPAEGDQSSRANRTKSAFRLAAFLQDAEGQPVAEQPAGTEPPATEPATTAETATTAEPAAPASSEAPASEHAAIPAAETSEPATSPPPAATDASALPSAATAAAEKPKEYQPLEEVADVIRRRLAGEKVREDTTKKMDELVGELDGEFDKYLGQRLDAEAQELEVPAPPATLLDFAALAEKYGFTAGKTGSLEGLELRNTPIGKSGTPESRLTLTGILFTTDELELYEPLQTADIDGNRYVVMKTSDEKERVPEFKDVKKEVLQAYKLQKAADLALKDAETQAKKAQEANANLTDFFAARPTIKVVRTDAFAQQTRGDVPNQFGMQPYRMSQPEGIVAAGPEFMQKVFALKPGEVGAVLNHDKSIAYVVKVAEHLDSVDELRDAYLAEANTWDGLPISIMNHMQLAQARLLNDVLASAHVDWKRDPDKLPQESEQSID